MQQQQRKAKPKAAPVVSILTPRAFEQMLAEAGYFPVDPKSRFAKRVLGPEAAPGKTWIQKHLLVTLFDENVVLVRTDRTGKDRAMLTTVRALDHQTLAALKAKSWGKK